MPKNLESFLMAAAGLLITLAAGWLGIRIILRFEKKALEKSRVDEALHLFILNASRIILWIAVIIAILPILHIHTASFLTVLGAGGAAVALALKDSLGNIAGGIIILINKPFSKGDLIEVAGVTGVVDSIDLLTTRLHTADNRTVSVPNGTVTTSVITNCSNENIRRVDCLFEIGYDSDIAKAKDIITEVADQSGMALSEPAPIIGVASHGQYSVGIDFKVWCATSDYYDLKYFMTENVKLAFDEQGIDIPFPYMDIHIVK